MEFLVLGPLEVRTGDATVHVAAAKPRALLAVLVANANRVVGTGALTDALWGEEPPPSANKLLQVYVSQLRKALPEGVLLTRPPGYLLAVPPEALDSARFERLLGEGRRAAREGNATVAARLLTEALAQWRGPAYDGLRDAEFARATAARLDELRLAAYEERFGADLALARAGAIVGEIAALAAEHPLRERLRALLVRALHLDGRQVEALAAYADARRALVDALGVEPGEELRAAHAVVLRQDPAPAVTAQPAPPPLPVPPTSLVGREESLAALEPLVTDDRVRLVTLTGPGGTGKTRLALAVAAQVGDRFANGVAFVPLATVTDAALVGRTIAEVLGVHETPQQPYDAALVDALRHRELLLVLDNVEQVLGAAALLADLLEAAPRLTLLVTSRSLLRLSAEHVYAVPPLAVDDAAALFAERAAAAGAPVGDDAHAVTEICRRLDGLPLAIELAAARLRLIPPAALLDRLGAHLDVLAGGARDLPRRHQTLRATLEWSYDLLDAEDRTLLGGLAVFAGGCSLEAAAAVCDAGLDRLAALADQSLLVAAGVGAPRFALLETTRAYAVERLDADGGGDKARMRHAAYFLDLAERADAEIGGPGQGAAMDLLAAEHDNLRAAFGSLAATGDTAGELRLAAALARFWYVRGHLTEGRARLDAALRRADRSVDPTRAKALRSSSALAMIHGDYAAAVAYAEDALTAYRALGDRIGAARSSNNLGAALVALGQYPRARGVLDETVALARAIGEPRLVALATNNRGDAALTEGDYPLAAECFTESLALLRALGDTANIARSLVNLAAAVAEQGRAAEADLLLRESLARCGEVGDVEDVAWCLLAFAALAEDPARAATLLGAADGVLGDLGALLKPYERGRYARTADRARALLGDAAFEAARREGVLLPRDRAVELATA